MNFSGRTPSHCSQASSPPCPEDAEHVWSTCAYARLGQNAYTLDVPESPVQAEARGEPCPPTPQLHPGPSRHTLTWGLVILPLLLWLLWRLLGGAEPAYVSWWVVEQGG